MLKDVKRTENVISLELLRISSEDVEERVLRGKKSF